MLLSGGSKPVSVVIGSAGRRLYLIRWFREAFQTLGVDGRVIVTESDISSAAFTAGDHGVLMPRYSDAAYEKAMLRMVEDLQPAMFLSVNDYELALLGGGLGSKLRDRGVVVPGICDQLLTKVTDKFLMARLLQDAGLPTPETVLASDAAGIRRTVDQWPRVVVKHRYGSGSSGLSIVDPTSLSGAIAQAAASAPGDDHLTPLERVVVQPYIEADEYGLDVVGSFEPPHQRTYRGLARRKIRMRAGETDKAVSVDPSDFAALAEKLGRTLEPMGLIDVDVLSSPDSKSYIIDINPRFGGGYPFVHLAGANVPLFYIASLFDGQLSDEWATYKSGIVSAKFEEARVSGSSA